MFFKFSSYMATSDAYFSLRPVIIASKCSFSSRFLSQ